MFKKFETDCQHIPEAQALNSLSKITEEAEKLTEIKDIIDELDILTQIIKDQSSICGVWKDVDSLWFTKMRDMLSPIAYAEDIDKMRQLALRTHESVSSLAKDSLPCLWQTL